MPIGRRHAGASRKDEADDDFDVVVVGGGGAGLAAAVSAAELGCRVALFEKNDRLGGTTRISVGSITANGTPHQERAGLRDSPDEHFEDMAVGAGDRAPHDNEVLRRLYVDNISETFRWLMRQGVSFHGPLPEPPHRVPRMHMVLPHSAAYVDRLARAARRHRVRLVVGGRAESLIRRDGRVEGVHIASSDGTSKAVYASRGVVLASGDFSGNGELKRRYLGEVAAATPAINPTSTGDGHEMAMQLGGEIRNGAFALGPQLRFDPPPRSPWTDRLPTWRVFGRIAGLALDVMPSGLTGRLMTQFLTTYMAPSAELFAGGAALVDQTGQEVRRDRQSSSLAVGTVGYAVFDHRTAVRFGAWPHYISTAPGIAYAYIDDYIRMRRDVVHRADSMNELATLIGADPTVLGRATPLARTPPFYALGPLRSWVVLTDGGLSVTRDLEVTNGSGKTIPGLFAAGSTGQGGVVLNGHGHHIGWAMVSGRIAGQRAAQGNSSSQ